MNNFNDAKNSNNYTDGISIEFLKISKENKELLSGEVTLHINRLDHIKHQVPIALHDFIPYE